jgi:serine phosphatase RsbU (regulator of sigma subunit)
MDHPPAERQVPRAVEPGSRPGESQAAELLTRLRVAELAIARLEGERDRLESMVVRLGALSAQLDADELVRGVIEAARDLTEAALAMFVPAERATPAEPTIISGLEGMGELPEPARVPLLAGAMWRVTPLRLDDTAQWDSNHAEAGSGYGTLADGRPLRSWIGAPVRSRHGEALGALFLAHHRQRAFGRREEELAQALAGHLGASLDNVTLFHERSRVARALQETLLPPVLPDVASLDIAARYRTARSTAFVGGDFYDVFESRPDVWSFIIGDVSGVGAEAAALTGIARYAARALASEVRTPARLLSRLNETLLRFDLQERFCTMLYAELRRAGAGIEVKIANGGHPYPLLLTSDGVLAEVEIHGRMLGILPSVPVEERVLTLAPGDLLVTYTDGVPEARDPGGSFFGTEGLLEVLRLMAGRSAASIARGIELAVVEHLAGVPSDDMAIVVLGAKAGNEHAQLAHRGPRARLFR